MDALGGEGRYEKPGHRVVGGKGMKKGIPTIDAGKRSWINILYLGFLETTYSRSLLIRQS